jgi:hypothetical protein
MGDKITKVGYRDLNDGQKTKIKDLGRKTYKNLISSFGSEVLNRFFEQNGIDLEYSAPSKEYLKKNIDDVNWALSNLNLDYNTSNKLRDELLSLEKQLESILAGKKTKWIEYFQEKSNKEWSLVNLLDNNIMFWLSHINRFLNNREINKNQIDKLIDRYFSEPLEGEPNGLAQDDLLISMSTIDSYNKTVGKTWESGSATEDSFYQFLLKNNFNKNDIYVFSGKKNVVDSIGIDLAIKCNGTWYPFQIKTEKITDYNVIPRNGFGAFPGKDSFVIIDKKGMEISLGEICGFTQKTNIPSSVDYFGSMGIK